MIIGTVVTRSHLARAKLLAQSIKRFNPEVKVVVSLLERYSLQDMSIYPHFDEVVLASQTWSGNFNQAIFKYSVKEASSFAGALLIQYMLDRYPSENQVVLLDSDMEILAPLHDLQSRLAQCSILLTPRRLYSDNDYDNTRYGVYNAGVIGVNRTRSGLAFVRWWVDRSERYSFLEYDPQNQSWLDEQKWLNQVPALFEGAQALKHAGYNVADWNYDEREISQDGGSHYLANGETLYIKHYHRIDDREKEIKSAEYAKKHPVLVALTKQYIDRLNVLGRDSSDLMLWSYQFFASGETIQPSTRLLYRNNLFLEEKYPNPYELSNEFFEWGMFGEAPPAVQPESDSKLHSPVTQDTTHSIVRRRSKSQQTSMKKSLKKRSVLNKQVRSRSTRVSGRKLVSIRSNVKKQHTWSFPHRKATPFLNDRSIRRRKVGAQ